MKYTNPDRWQCSFSGGKWVLGVRHGPCTNPDRWQCSCSGGEWVLGVRHGPERYLHLNHSTISASCLSRSINLWRRNGLKPRLHNQHQQPHDPSSLQTQELTSHLSCTSYTSPTSDNSHDHQQTPPSHQPPSSQRYPRGPGSAHNPADADNHRREYVHPFPRLLFPLDYSLPPHHRRLRPLRHHNLVLASRVVVDAVVGTSSRLSRGLNHRWRPWLGLGI